MNRSLAPASIDRAWRGSAGPRRHVVEARWKIVPVRLWFRLRALALAGLATISLGLIVFVIQFARGHNFHEVVPGVVYRSGQPDTQFLRKVRDQYQIRSVVNLRGEWVLDDWYQAEKQAARELDLHHVDVNLRTHRLAPKRELAKLIDALDNAPKPLLLHCRRGADRTSLAAAIHMLLFEGKSPEDALEEYSVWYGHVRFAYGSHLPHLFDCYREWLDRNGHEHTPARFREWVHGDRAIGYFGAAITANDVQRGRPGTDQLEFHVTNVSTEPWHLTGSPRDGIHMEVRFCHPSDDQRIHVKSATAGIVQPGETVTFHVPIPAKLTRPADYSVFADLLDRYDFRFCEMGVGGCCCTLRVESDTN